MRYIAVIKAALFVSIVPISFTVNAPVLLASTAVLEIESGARAEVAQTLCDENRMLCKTESNDVSSENAGGGYNTGVLDDGINF